MSSFKIPVDLPMSRVLLPTGTRKNERDVPNHPYRAELQTSAL